MSIFCCGKRRGYCGFFNKWISLQYWKGRCFPTYYTTAGGLKINGSAGVTGGNDLLIPGLYAADGDAGSLYGDAMMSSMRQLTGWFCRQFRPDCRQQRSRLTE